MPPKSNNRKRNYDSVHVRLDETEARQVKRNAENTGLSKAALMRELAIGHVPKATLDSTQINQLIVLRKELNRRGRLLKLWLEGDEKTQNYKPHDMMKIVNNVNSIQRQIRFFVDRLNEPKK